MTIDADRLAERRFPAKKPSCRSCRWQRRQQVSRILVAARIAKGHPEGLPINEDGSLVQF
jgi:hypothetical protein